MRVLLLFWLLTASAASASPITLIVEGETNSLSDAAGILPFSDPEQNALWRLTVTYNSAAPDNLTTITDENPIDRNPTLGSYPSAVQLLSLSVDGLAAGAPMDSASLSVINDQPGAGFSFDNWIVSGGTGLFVPSETPGQSKRESLVLILSSTGPLGSSVSPLTSDDLVTPGPASDWEVGEIRFTLDVRDDASGSITTANATATITNITVVPIPAAAALFSAGLMSLVGFARRRSSV